MIRRKHPLLLPRLSETPRTGHGPLTSREDLRRRTPELLISGLPSRLPVPLPDSRWVVDPVTRARDTRRRHPDPLAVSTPTSGKGSEEGVPASGVCPLVLVCLVKTGYMEV